MNFDSLEAYLKATGIHLLYGVLILVIGLVAVHWTVRLFRRYEARLKLEPTVKSFLINLIRVLLDAIVILTAAGQIGIPLTSVFALLASVGVAVSLAMQGALSNLVGGLMLLILQPMKAGEYIKVGELEGTVRTIGAFYTELVTLDGRRVSVPNSSLTNTAIINYSREGKRRIDLTFSVAYGSDADAVRRALAGAAEHCEHLFAEPAPEVLLDRCADSSINFILRVWTAPAHYWDVYFFLQDAGKKTIDRAGITIPFPQVDVHIKEH